MPKDVKDIVLDWLKTNGCDGLCNDDCGCGVDDFAPCEEGPWSNCIAAQSRVLGPDEYIGECGPDDTVFVPVKF